MSDISSNAAAAREAARQDNGKFGAQENAEAPATDLTNAEPASLQALLQPVWNAGNEIQYLEERIACSDIVDKFDVEYSEEDAARVAYFRTNYDPDEGGCLQASALGEDMEPLMDADGILMSVEVGYAHGELGFGARRFAADSGPAWVIDARKVRDHDFAADATKTRAAAARVLLGDAPPVWPQDDEERAAFADYQLEVANGDVAASFREWYIDYKDGLTS